MSDTPSDDPNETKPAEFSRPVSSSNQFQLPEVLVREVGFKSPAVDSTDGAKARWYSHEDGEKLILAHKDIDHPALTPEGVSSLTDISNDDIASGNVSGAKVTIVSDLPEHHHERLTRDAVVLKPLYKEAHADLDWTYVSVYPAEEYYNGELSHVCYRQTEHDGLENEDDEETRVVGEYHSHANSI